MSPRGGRREGAGRKPIPEESRRRNRVMVSLTDSELEQLTAHAEGEALSSYLARLIRRHLARKSPRR